MEEKKSFKERWIERWDKILDWAGEHPDVLLTVAGGIMSLVGGGLKLYATKSDFNDHLYTTIDDEVYKIPAKHMKTTKSMRSED